jgi:hypothetical protein
MHDPIVAALSGEDVVHSNSLATVTTSCVVIRTANARSRVIISATCISSVRRIIYAYPAFVPIAAGCFIVAAAAHSSKEGTAADLPLAILALLFLLTFFTTRRASVLFQLETDQIESAQGSVAEASAIIQAVLSIQARAADPVSRKAVA